MSQPIRIPPAVTLLLALAYFATGRLGLMLPAFGSNVTLIWLPTGIAVAALLRWGFGCWPGIALGAVAVNLAVGTSWPVALGIAVGNTLGPLLAAWVLRRLKFHPAFDRSRDILLLAAAAALGMLVSSGLGAATLAVVGPLKPGTFAHAWLTWWGGDALGVIAAAPLVLTFTLAEVRAILRRRGEFLIWITATGLTTWAVFVANRGAAPGQALALAFIPLPYVAWAALRFGPVGTSLGLILLSAIAAYGTATQSGPFYRADAVQDVVLLWLFMATSAVLGWLISALNTRRRQSVGIQRLFEQALSDVSLGVLLAGLDRRITYANHGFTKLTGYTEAELQGKSCALLQGPETDPATVEKLKAAVHADGFFDGEIVNYRKDGTTFWNALLISPVRDESGVMTGFLAIQRDITKRKQAEFALSQSEEHLRTIIELEPECVKLLSPDGKLLEMNPAGLAMIEACSLDEVRGLPVSDLVVPEDRAAFAAAHRQALEGGTGRCEFAVVGLKGTRRWLETHAVPYRNARREIIGVLGITRDITQRKAAEAELERSFSTLDLFINTVPAYISYVDAEERYRLVNKRYEEYFGRSAAQVIGERLCDVQPAAAYAEMQPHVRTALGGQTVRYQSHPTGPDGKSYWLDVQYVPRRGEGGAVTGFFVLVFDISESKKAEAALRKSEAQFRTLTESAPILIYLTDENGECIYVNRRWCEAAGMTPAEAAGHGWLNALHAEDRTSIGELWKRSVESGGTWGFEYRFDDRAGRVTWVYGTAAPILAPDGKVIGYVGTNVDVTERKRAEEERARLLHSLQESQVRLQTLVSNLPGMAYRCLNDPNWTMSYVSEGCEAVTSYRRDELENNRSVAYGDLVHADDRDWLWAKCQASLDARTPCQNEYRILDRNGRERWVVERASGVYTEDGALLAIDGFIQDITAARQAKIEREQIDRKMQETQKLESLGVLAGGIAHDFNNLLTAILGNASIAQIELPPGSPAQDCLEQINEASLRAADLCKQMLAYSGRGRFVVQKLNLGELVEQTAQMLQISISKKAVLRYRLEKGLPPVEVDATQMRQVIMNLVINASEAIGDASGVISISTGLTRVDRHYLRGTLMDPDLPEGDFVFLEVSDSGCGMSAETQARIFDPFFTTKFTGRGLGLAVVLGIVRGHKGAMKVYSEVGRGTTFKLLFPAAAGASETAAARPAASVGWQAKGMVLVVDDEETMRSTISRMMRIIGLEPVLACDGRDAIEIFGMMPDKFVLVLLDLTMPHMDGEQTFTELRRLRPDVRVVLMSGFNAQEALLRFPGKGLASFLQKPFTIVSLSATLKEVLDGKEATSPARQTQQ